MNPRRCRPVVPQMKMEPKAAMRIFWMAAVRWRRERWRLLPRDTLPGRNGTRSLNLQSAHVTTTSLSTNRKQGTPMTRFPVVSLKRLILGTWSPRALSRHLASLRKLFISVRIIGPGCGMSEPRGITQAGVIAAHCRYYCLYAWDGYIYSHPWDDRSSALAHARRHRHRY
jgi:hypothetical protein